MNRLVAAALCTVTMTGCFFGRSPTAKTIAYTTNGALVGVGLLEVANKRDSDEGNVSRAMGAIAITAGVLGIIANLAIPGEQTSTPIAAHAADGNAASITY